MIAPGSVSGDDWVCLGEITGAVGIRGEVRVRTFTATPEAIASYGPLTVHPGGRQVSLSLVRPAKAGVVARIAGVGDRNGAEALKGARLHVVRAALPEPEGEDDFYHADLVGLVVEDNGGRVLGRVRAVHDFGAGDVLDIAPAPGGKPFMVAFTRDAVPVVDVAAGRLIVAVVPEDGE